MSRIKEYKLVFGFVICCSTVYTIEGIFLNVSNIVNYAVRKERRLNAILYNEMATLNKSTSSTKTGLNQHSNRGEKTHRALIPGISFAIGA